ncbi:MAG: ABC transporter ATP-binding protein, partial [Vulcanimicrobiota bacterium]
KIVEEKLTIVDLHGKQDHFPSELSGGMQKRASLARAICADPEIVLYDEPTTGLDPIISNVINKLVLDLKERLQVTSVIVTHDLNSAYMIATEIAMLHEGKIIEKGTPDEFRNSDNPIVKQFVSGSTDGPIKV